MKFRGQTVVLSLSDKENTVCFCFRMVAADAIV